MVYGKFPCHDQTAEVNTEVFPVGATTDRRCPECRVRYFIVVREGPVLEFQRGG